MLVFFVILNCLTLNGVLANHVSYIPGNTNIIITAPHGGNVKDIGCLPRINGCRMGNGGCQFDSGRQEKCPGEECKINPRADTNTRQIAHDLAALIEKGLEGNKRPHLIIMHAHRSQIDANRADLGEACMGCKPCLEAYQQYHELISNVSGKLTNGILFDIHGQAHKQNSTELGYAVDKEVIDAAVLGLDDDINAAASTIEALSARKDLSLKTLVLGNESLGAFLEAEGFAGLPSPGNPKAEETNYKYYVGGHTVRAHSSEKMDAIQVEAPSEVRLDKYNMRGKYTKALAKAILRFCQTYGYGK